MKKLLYLIPLTILTSCDCNDNNTNKSNDRIIGIERTNYRGVIYQIIEVDGVEYLSNSDGGIIPLEDKYN